MGRVAAGYVRAGAPLVYEATDGRKDTACASTRRPGSTRARSRPAAAAARGGGGMRLPDPRRWRRQDRPRHDRGDHAVRRAHPVHGLDVLGGGIRPAAATSRPPTVPDRRGREQVRGVRRRPVHQLGAELLDAGLPRADGQAVRRRSRPCASRGRPTPAAARPARRWGRSTARTTARSTSTPPSSTTCSRASSAPRAGRSRSAT